MPTIHAHEEGYYILKFNTVNECSEILKGGPYFLNKAPLIVKQWSVNFDVKEEILRVIPVWVRLPNLPLHCWGAESLSRIVSAIGVPILADECTAKQSKVSFARVLVEIDVTKEFVKDIRVRDNNGREFNQLAIPEWRPFFCRKCNKLDHECKEGSGANDTQQQPLSKEGEKHPKEKHMWIPRHIANLVKGTATFDEIRKKMQTHCENREQQHTVVDEATEQCTAVAPTEQQPANETKGGTVDHEQEEEGAWTPVPPNKTARRHQNSSVMNHKAVTYTVAGLDNSVFEEPLVEKEQQMGGNPQVPSV